LELPEQERQRGGAAADPLPAPPLGGSALALDARRELRDALLHLGVLRRFHGKQIERAAPPGDALGELAAIDRLLGFARERRELRGVHEPPTGRAGAQRRGELSAAALAATRGGGHSGGQAGVLAVCCSRYGPLNAIAWRLLIFHAS